MTVSNSLTMKREVSVRSLVVVVSRSLSSRILAIRSSRVSWFWLFRDRGEAKASKISSSELPGSPVDVDSLLIIFRASLGLPPTAVVPPRLLFGELQREGGLGMAVKLEDIRRSVWFILAVRAVRPSSHSVSRLFISLPIASYCSSR